MQKYRGLIKCNECGKKYKGKMYRDKQKYVCSGRANYGTKFCICEPISEEELDFYVEMKYKRVLNGEEIQEEVEEVIMHQCKFEIKYKDGHVQFYDKAIMSL
jgi:hypothetical protein